MLTAIINDGEAQTHTALLTKQMYFLCQYDEWEVIEKTKQYRNDSKPGSQWESITEFMRHSLKGKVTFKVLNFI